MEITSQPGFQQVIFQACNMKAPEFLLCLDYDYVFNLGPYVALIFKIRSSKT